MALTGVAIRQAKPGPKQYKVADGEGIYLLVTPAGGKLWRLKYRLAGKEKLMAFGAYPEVSLSDARKRRDEARQQLAASKDPSREKQRAKVRQQAEAMNTFAIISSEYCAKRKSDGQGGWSPATSTRSEYLGPEIFPDLTSRAARAGNVAQSFSASSPWAGRTARIRECGSA